MSHEIGTTGMHWLSARHIAIHTTLDSEINNSWCILFFHMLVYVILLVDSPGLFTG
jgi:hypothetical protein